MIITLCNDPKVLTEILIESIRNNEEYKKTIMDYFLMDDLPNYPCAYDLCLGMCNQWAERFSTNILWLGLVGPYKMDHCVAIKNDLFCDPLDPEGVVDPDKLTIQTYTRQEWIDFNLE